MTTTTATPLQIHEAQQMPNRINLKKVHTQPYIKIKLLKIKANNKKMKKKKNQRKLVTVPIGNKKLNKNCRSHQKPEGPKKVAQHF